MSMQKPRCKAESCLQFEENFVFKSDARTHRSPQHFVQNRAETSSCFATVFALPRPPRIAVEITLQINSTLTQPRSRNCLDSMTAQPSSGDRALCRSFRVVQARLA